ncbi:TPA: restriction endonuclease subunit S [Elizabethkingia anophelis]
MIKYNNFKDSEIEGLGLIPSSWKIDRIKNIGSVNGRVGWKALKASEYVESGYFFLSTPNIKNVDIDFVNVNFITADRYYESPEIMLRNGDILLVKDGSTLGIVNVVRDLPSHGTVNSSIAVLRIKQLNSIYGYYFLLSNYIQNVIQLKKDGMGVPHLFQKDINNFEIIIPPILDQTAIAEFLDIKTQAIDKKVKLLEKKIGYYQELRKSLINEAIIKGLDQNIKLKDSNIDWIGQIPKHWEMKRIDSLFKERSEKVSDIDFKPLSVSMNGIVPQMDGTAKTQNNENRKRVRSGDIVLNSRSDRRGASGLSNYDGSVSVISIVITPLSSVNGNYFHHFFKSHVFTEEFYKKGKGIVDDLWSTKYTIMRTFMIPVPPLNEQEEIAKFLDVKLDTIAKIIANIQTQIITLKELRKTLINDVVTGKIKVTKD